MKEFKMLVVDLSNCSSHEAPLSDEIIKNYLGGRGLGAKLLWDRLAPSVDPMGEENELIFAVGPTQGTLTYYSDRSVLVTKSPLTGIYLYSVAGGGLGLNLRRCGYMALVIRGKALSPVYLWIKNDKVEFRDARGIWGKMTTETQKTLLTEINDEEASTAVIGPAGEKMVKIAAVFSERTRSFARGGPGAVMGAKNLKGVVIKGNKPVSVDNPELIRESASLVLKKLRSNKDWAEIWMNYGTGNDIHILNEMGALPTRNWQTGTFEGMEKLDTTYVRKKWTKISQACGYLCPTPCNKVSLVRNGEYAGASSMGPEYETIYALGSNLGIDRFDAIIAAENLCDEFGLDTMSTGVAIGFAMECYEKGLINKTETEGVQLNFGNHRAMMDLIPKIAKKEGFGDILSDGVKGIAQTIGKGSDFFAMHGKGMELGGYECRVSYAQAIQYAFSSRGGCHHDLGNPIRAEMAEGNVFEVKGKGKLVKRAAILRIIYDSTIVCTFSRRVLGLEPICMALSAILGINIDEKELALMGERILNVERSFNVREGVRRNDDRLPSRLLAEGIPDGPHKGFVVPLEELKDEFYKELGWDMKTGIPDPSTLQRLNLFEIDRELTNIRDK